MVAVKYIRGISVDEGSRGCVCLVWCVGWEQDVVDVTRFSVFDSSWRRARVHSGNDGVETVLAMVKQVGEDIVLVVGGELGV